MIISRWQAPTVPTIEQIKMMFVAEGLEPQEELFDPKVNVPEHRHPFDEILVVAEGTLLLNVSGNRLLLRPGDRIQIPANTRHSYAVEGDDIVKWVSANRPF